MEPPNKFIETMELSYFPYYSMIQNGLVVILHSSSDQKRAVSGVTVPTACITATAWVCEREDSAAFTSRSPD